MSHPVLLDLIYKTPRKNLESKLFDNPCQISLLSFIGADDYFITEFGAIWNRNKIYPDKNGKLSRYYLPWVFKDQIYQQPWSLVPTTAGPLWFPIMQLLGWAFYFINDRLKRYYLPHETRLYPYHAADGQWTELPPIPSPRSFYLKWIQALYE